MRYSKLVTFTLLRFDFPVKKCVSRAATVSIVGFDLKVIKMFKIYHEPGSYIVNYYTRKINGFEADTFRTGQNEIEVKKEIEKALQNKLIILCSAGSDFSMLDLKARDFDYFDIQSHFYAKVLDEQGSYVNEPHSLLSIFRHYFPNEEFQSAVHDATSDAVATMKIFKDV